ncbi:glutathione S-transferase family protein [Microvirga sp. 3-52]|uniref:glutathione S-transferase family protein n=1 Tax=Microvirga sp. 3-52 TaxID=2792425 RepID=UPI001AD09778|nr:glutathione S-transferase family protein [Microvirga sp. 3-52]MBO1908176.1 glutathione S-transferase family protein [Microvirga sp. 3-52]MBS7454597.1 glutathione S-transferase family protein [Microvirga sp. 3-52]
MITITAMKWVPPFAAGSVRDHRGRWILNEVGWAYQVRLVDAPTLASAEYRTLQPFGQVPIMEEDGRPTLFESGAIVLDVATRSGKLLPSDPNQRAETIMWVIAALNSIEPFLMNLAEVEFFMSDETEKSLRRPAVLAAAKKRLGELQDALGGRQWLVGDSFTVGGLMMSSVLKIASSLKVLEDFPALVAYQARCFERPAYRKAIDDQCATIARHRMEDMRYEEA